MKKVIQHIFLVAALLVGFSGCVKEAVDEGGRTGDVIPYPAEGRAVVSFSVSVPGPGFNDTKAMADTPNITSLRVVVFGSSGFLKESVDVDPLDFTSATTNGNSTLYSYKVHLSLTDSKRLRVHVIANCDVQIPWKYEDVVMTTHAYTTGNQDAYWARFELPNGITLQKVWDETEQEMKYVQDVDGFYQVTQDVTDAFTGNGEGLPLLRNFAKISVESTTPQLVLNSNTTMAVINRPDRGSVAPYNSADGTFLMNYKDCLYLDSEHPENGLKQSYPGFSPVGMQYVDTNPDNVPFTSCVKDGNNVVGGVYMFERPKPGANDVPSYIIIHGTYYPLLDAYNSATLPSDWKSTEAAHPGTYLNLANGQESYYKIDLMDQDGYYAVLRNFRYHIRITNVSKPGADTPGAAGSTGGTGDISQDTAVQNLTDISDGYGRIVVGYVGWTFVDATQVWELKYKFIPDAELGDTGINNALSSETVNGQPGPVSITIGEKTGAVNVFSSTLDNSISSAAGVEVDGGANGKVKVMGDATAKDGEGFRIIKFTVNEPDAVKTSQTIRILGQIDEYKSIYRDVTFYLMSRQTMTVECLADVPNPDYGEDYVENVAGQGVNVRITIPKGLPESMFPLDFSIESDKLSITPNTAKYPQENLPVVSGASICQGSSSQSFHYVRTLSYEEYAQLPESLQGVYFTCHFVTNKAGNASTVYVDNEYFNKGSDAFHNYSLFNFKNLSFSNNNVTAGGNVNFTFSLDDEDAYTSPGRTVVVKLDALVPQNANAAGWSVVDADEGLFAYTISSGRSATLALRAISANQGFDGSYAVTLSAFDSTPKAIYHEASHGNKAQRVTVSPRTLELRVGDSDYLSAQVWPASLGAGNITWTSGNTSVATVNAEGKVTAVSIGTVQITATCGDVAASCTVTVIPTPVKGVSLNKSTLTMATGNANRQTLVATVRPTNATNKNVTWSSSNPSVATVDANGVVTGVAVGNATITVTTVDGGHTATCLVKVRQKKTITVTEEINTNTGTFTSFDNNSGSYTNASGVTVDVTNVQTRNANYLEMGYRTTSWTGGTNYNGTLKISSSSLTDFTVTKVVFTYTENNYAQGGVTFNPNTGAYSRSGAAGTWTGSTSNPITFTMAPRSTGGWNATYYWNRVRMITVTYTYTTFED